MNFSFFILNYLLAGLILSTIGGQFFRIPYLQGTGILFTDLILGIIGIFWLFKLITKQTKIAFNKTNLILILFLLFTLISLFLNIYQIPTSDALISLFYYLRFLSYTALFFIIQTTDNKQLTTNKVIFKISLFTAFTLTLLGFLQLKFFPNFEILRMQEKGWDPHIGRMLSTWFDPNFLGGFFTLILSLIGGVLIIRLNKKKNFLLWLSQKENLFLGGIFLFILMGLVLTYSRSAYLSFLVAMLLLTLIASRRLLIVGIIGVIFVFSISTRLQTRVIDAYESAQSLFNPYSFDTLDATARFRIQSWQDGFDLFLEKPLIGQGFNTLRYIQAKRGLTEWKGHNAGGIDSSLITILATTGIIGFGLFLTFLYLLLQKSYQNYKKITDTFSQGINLGYFCGIIGLLIHSFFVNSLLFPFIMIFLWIFGGIILNAKR